MKKKIYDIYLFLHHCLVYFSCVFNLPKICAYLIKISLFQPSIFKNKSDSKKIIIILDRVLGARRDLEIVQKSSKNLPQIFFMRRRICKLIYFYFFNKKKFFFNYAELQQTNRFNYYDLKTKQRYEIENFWNEVIFNFKKFYKNEELNLITFAYFYSTEYPLYIACNKNNIPVKLWNKECFGSEPDLLFRSKSKQFKNVCEYFNKISVYNEPMKKLFLNINKNNIKKIYVTGYPKIIDFMNRKKSYKKKITKILFLSFDTKLGFPMDKRYEKLNFNYTYDKVIKILNLLSKYENIKICIKRKNKNPILYKSNIIIDKKIKVVDVGNATKYINEADIVIGLNSSSTLEALVNGKLVFVPFFEKKSFLKKYLFRFPKNRIYTSEKKMINEILSLINKIIIFPTKNKQSKKTIKYYFGNIENTKKINNNCVKFLNA